MTSEAGAPRALRLLIVAVATIGFGCVPRSSRAAAAHLEPTSSSGPSVTAVEGYATGADGVRLFYRKLGSGRPVVVFLHGGPGLNFEDGGPDLEPLGVGRTLLMYDQRGGGRSDLISDAGLLAARHHVRDLEELRKNFGLERLTLAGLSWGSGLAALYASQHPSRVERMLLLSPMPPARDPFLEQRGKAMIASLGPERFARLRELFDAYHTASDSELPAICRELDNLLLQPYLATPTARARLRGDTCRYPAAALRSQGKNGLVIQDSLGDWDFRPLLAGIQIPTLVVEGADTTVPLDATREWVARLPNARLLLVPGAGHMPFVEQPEAFFGPVIEFLRGSWPSEAHK